jgi:RNA polymerase sigma-70 factor, ECF subfamily
LERQADNDARRRKDRHSGKILIDTTRTGRGKFLGALYYGDRGPTPTGDRGGVPMVGLPDETARSLGAARAGSPEALGRVLEACRFYLLGVADRDLDDGLRAEGEASDLVQETLLEARRDLVHFRGETEADLLAWLRRLLRNNMADFHRHRRRADGVEVATPGLADSGPPPSARMVGDDRALELQWAMERLPDEHRCVLFLRYQKGLSFEEIARLLGRTPDAARTLWGRAVERLQRELEPTP